MRCPVQCIVELPCVETGVTPTPGPRFRHGLRCTVFMIAAFFHVIAGRASANWVRNNRHSAPRISVCSRRSSSLRCHTVHSAAHIARGVNMRVLGFRMGMTGRTPRGEFGCYWDNRCRAAARHAYRRPDPLHHFAPRALIVGARCTSYTLSTFCVETGYREPRALAAQVGFTARHRPKLYAKYTVYIYGYA